MPSNDVSVMVYHSPLFKTTWRHSSALSSLARPVVLVGHAYAGAVIAATRNEDVKGLVYVAALAPDEGETVADVFYRIDPHPRYSGRFRRRASPCPRPRRGHPR